MPRGGKREGAGRKTTWASGRKIEDTTVIRVPKEFADQLLEIAHKLDAGESIDSVTDSKNDIVTESKLGVLLPQLIEYLAKWRDAATKASLKTTRWDQARKMLTELESLISNSEKIDLVTESEKQVVIPASDLVAEPEALAEQEKTLNATLQLELLNSTSDLSKKGLILSASELAKRLNTDVSNVVKHKNGKRRIGLTEWTKKLDPERLAWEYSEEIKKYKSL